MSVAAVMLVKDEADIIETTVRHLLAQVDEVIVSDNLSTDGTADILRRLYVASGGRVLVSEDTERGYYQDRKTTALALLALERGHRWVVPCDADEIWLAGDGRTLRDFLDGVSRDVQFVKAAIYNHVATSSDPDEPNPVRRIGWRQRQPLEYRWWKVACRLRPDLRIEMGNHSARTDGTGREESGLELRHFPYRSAEQFVRKAVNGRAAYESAPERLAAGYGAHWVGYGKHVERAGEQGGADWFHEHFYSRDPDADDSLEFDPAPVAWPAPPDEGGP